MNSRIKSAPRLVRAFVRIAFAAVLGFTASSCDGSPVGFVHAVKFLATVTIATVKINWGAPPVPAPGPGDVLILDGAGPNGSTGALEYYVPGLGQFISAGSGRASRTLFGSAWLPNGDVFVSGGSSFEGAISASVLAVAAPVLDSAEEYDRDTGALVPSTMTVPRAGGTATLLNNGKVLVAGGIDATGQILDSAETFDPATDKFTALTSKMSSPRALHSAILLDNGTVLLAGGFTDTQTWATTASADIFDPVTGTFSPTGTLGDIGVAGAVAVKITGSGPWAGAVLIAGGTSTLTVSGVTSTNTTGGFEVYDPTGAGTIFFGFMSEARTLAAANDLGNGKILITGGFNGGARIKNGDFTNLGGFLSNSGEIEDFSTEVPSSSCIKGGPNLSGQCEQSMTEARAGHTATLFSSGVDAGKVLIAGGFGGPLTGTGLSTGPFAALNSAEIYNPATGTTAATGNMNTARALAAAFLLPGSAVTPKPTPTPTARATPTELPTRTATRAQTRTATRTPSRTATRAPSPTHTPMATATRTATRSPTRTAMPTPSPTRTPR